MSNSKIKFSDDDLVCIIGLGIYFLWTTGLITYTLLA